MAGQRTIIFANRRDETRDLYERSYVKRILLCLFLSGKWRSKRGQDLKIQKRQLSSACCLNVLLGRASHVDNVGVSL